MKKLLFLLLVSGSALAETPEEFCYRIHGPGSKSYAGCIDRINETADPRQTQPVQAPQAIYVPQPVYVQPKPQPYQMPTNVFQAPNLPTHQQTTTNCRRMLDGSVSCTTY